jgi:hypothetical protein
MIDNAPHACVHAHGVHAHVHRLGKGDRRKGQRKVETVVTTELFFQYCGDKPQPTSTSVVLLGTLRLGECSTHTAQHRPDMQIMPAR